MFNTLSDHHHTLTDLAANCGIDWHKLRERLAFDGHPVKRNIELTKAYKNKVWAIGNRWTAPDGKNYHQITFKTLKGGGYSATFNEWHETQHDRDNVSLQPILCKSTQPKPTHKPDKWQINALKQAAEAFDTASHDNVATHPYLVEKSVNVEGVDIRRGVGKYGDCVMVAIRDRHDVIIGYQQIYADNLPNKETNKHFIGKKGGGFIVIGHSAKIKESAIFCEGLATGLSIYHAEGNGKTTLNNADKTPIIVCLDAGNLAPVIEQFKELCADIRIFADNDTGKAHGNTGVFVALEAAKKYGIKSIIVPVSTDGNAVDFNDTLAFQAIQISTKPLDYLLQLIASAPKQQLNRLGKQLACTLANEVPRHFTVEQAVAVVLSALATRGNDGTKVNVLGIISNHVKKRSAAVKQRNQIINKIGIVRHDLRGLDNAQITRHIAESGGGIWLDNRGLGAGKTKLLEQLTGLLAAHTIAYVCHRVSLVKDASNRLNILSYHDTEPNEYPQHIGLCVNSAAKYGLNSRYSVLFIDEFRQTLEHIERGTVKNRKECLATLISAIERAELVVCSDADLNDACVTFLRQHSRNKSINLIETDSNPNPKTIHLLASHNAAYAAIHDELVNGGKPFIACTSRTEAIKLHTYLCEQGFHPDRLLLVHSKNRGDDKQAEFLADTNGQATLYDCVIHSPTIGSGVSIETPHFTTNYLLHAGNLPSNECLQMTARNRCTNDIVVSFSAQSVRDRVTDLELLQQGENAKGDRFINADYLIQNKDGYVINELGKLRIDSQRAINDDLNDFANHFLLLTELNGYAINRDNLSFAPDKTVFNGLATRVKKERVTDVFNAEIIDTAIATTLDKKQAPTQADSNQLDRHKTVVMAGTPDITLKDVQHFMDGAVKQVINFETVNGSIEECLKFDRENAKTANKSSSKVSIHALFDLSVTPLLADALIIDKATAAKVCTLLKSHAAELASNGLGNYDKSTFTHPIITLGRFINRFGYELVTVSKDRRGVRTFKVQVMAHIAKYAENRKVSKASL